MSKKQKMDKIDKLFLKAQKKLITSFISIKKMREFLFKQGANKKEIDEIIEKLKRYSFINEEEIVNNVMSYADSKHYGYNRIITMLKQREISSSLTMKVKRDEAREQEESKKALNRLKRRYKNKNTFNLKRSVYCCLIRYGFDENIASIRASEVSNSPKEEINMLILDYKKLLSSNARKNNGNIDKSKISKTLLAKGYNLNDIKKVIEVE